MYNHRCVKWSFWSFGLLFLTRLSRRHSLTFYFLNNCAESHLPAGCRCRPRGRPSVCSVSRFIFRRPLLKRCQHCDVCVCIRLKSWVCDVNLVLIYTFSEVPEPPENTTHPHTHMQVISANEVKAISALRLFYFRTKYLWMVVCSNRTVCRDGVVLVFLDFGLRLKINGGHLRYWPV